MIECQLLRKISLCFMKKILIVIIFVTKSENKFVIIEKIVQVAMEISVKNFKFKKKI